MTGLGTEHIIRAPAQGVSAPGSAGSSPGGGRTCLPHLSLTAQRPHWGTCGSSFADVCLQSGTPTTSRARVRAFGNVAHVSAVAITTSEF